MKVLFVSSGNAKTGINIIVKNQGDSLKNKGVDLEYFFIKNKGLLGYLKHIFLLKKRLKKEKYDIVHAHYGLCGIVGYFAISSEPLVVSFMGDDLIGENRVNGSYTLFGNLLVFINKWFARKKFKTIIVKSTQMQKLIANSNCIVLPNGVDFERFYPVDKHEAKKKLGVRAQERMILFVSDPNRPEKNFKLAEKAYALLNDSSCKLQVVNGVSPESLNLYYNVADVCLLTSFHEGSPNVIKEAMACNCPIVSTEVGDVKEVIGSTKGCYITPFEPKVVAEKLKTALSFGKRINGRQNIRHLECSVIAEKLINIYKDVLKSR